MKRNFAHFDLSDKSHTIAEGIETFGNTNTWVTIAKAWNDREQWMKSTKALEIEGVGCLVQVTTQHESHIAEALAFVPGAKIGVDKKGYPKLSLML